MKPQKHYLYYKDALAPVAIYLGWRGDEAVPDGKDPVDDHGDLMDAWKHLQIMGEAYTPNDSKYHMTADGSMVVLTGLIGIVPAQPEEKK
mgnify:CR=1 FL=1